jgi:hypothetical protein
MIRWEQQSSGSWFGYSAELMIAMVVRISNDNNTEGWHWRVDGARNPVGWMNAGHRKSADSARLAAMRYWNRWLEHAGLALAAKPVPSAERLEQRA